MSNFKTKVGDITQFSEMLVASRNPVIELNSAYGTSLLRDELSTTGSGQITTSEGEIVLSTGATASSRAFLKAAEVGRYIPGYGAELGVGIRFTGAPTGTQVARWGGESEDGNNGFYFGYDSTGLYVARKRAGTETKIYRSDWNIDQLNGLGKSGYTLDLTKGVICQIQFTWYGYGQIIYGVLGVINNQQSFLPVHQISNVDFVGTSITSPNIKVFGDVENNDETSDLSMRIGGRQYSIVGNYNPKYRFTGEFRGSVNTSTTVVPLISFRRKSAFNDRSIKIENYNILAATEDVVLQIRLGATLTGASFGTPTDYIASETALESDKAATAVSGGTVVWTGAGVSSQGNRTSLSNADFELDIPNGTTVTLCARTFSGTGTVKSEFKLREEW